MRSKNITYLIGVDHLRAYAALLVVLYHGTQLISADITHGSMFVPELDYAFTTWNPFKSLIAEGSFGVALFMTLSGFIFAFGLYGKSFTTQGFFKNRFVRIFPLYLFLIFLTLYLYGGGQNVLNGLLFSILPLANIPSSGLATGVIASAAMFWTIAVEVQFYLIFPFLMRWLNEHRFRLLLSIIGLFIVLRVLAVLAGDVNMTNFAYFSIFGRIDQFILGMLTGYLFKNRHLMKKYIPSRSLVLLIISSLTVVLLLFIMNRLRHHFGFHTFENFYIILPTIEALAACFLIITYVNHFHSKTKSFISTSIAKIGEISYSMYLLHFLIISLLVGRSSLPDIFGNPWLSSLLYTIVIVVPGTIGLSFMTYTVIEKPFLELRGKYTTPRTK